MCRSNEKNLELGVYGGGAGRKVFVGLYLGSIYDTIIVRAGVRVFVIMVSRVSFCVRF